MYTRLFSLSHPFGTDHLGRDLLARFSIALRQTVIPLWGMVCVAFFIGVICSGGLYLITEKPWGKFIVLICSTFSMALLAIPFGVSVFAISVYFEEIDFSGVLLTGFFYVSLKTFTRVNGLTLESQKMGYWVAHDCMGGSRLNRFIKYGIGSSFREKLISDLIFSFKLLFAAEVTLSYLGFGVSEPNPSLGNILAANIEDALKGEPRIFLLSLGVFSLVMVVPGAARLLLIRSFK